MGWRPTLAHVPSQPSQWAECGAQNHCSSPASPLGVDPATSTWAVSTVDARKPTPAGAGKGLCWHHPGLQAFCRVCFLALLSWDDLPRSLLWCQDGGVAPAPHPHRFWGRRSKSPPPVLGQCPSYPITGAYWVLGSTPG